MRGATTERAELPRLGAGSRKTSTKETRKIRCSSGRVLEATPVFDTYLRFACERQRIFLSRVEGRAQPWTDDSILQDHRFTNVFRASDRVSQYLIREVQYSGPQEPTDLFFRTILFKLFNRIDTWRYLERALGDISWGTFSYHAYVDVLDALFATKSPVYSGAYIIPCPALGGRRKHHNHLLLVQQMMMAKAAQQAYGAKSLEDVFLLLRSFPSMGDFLAFQFTIDLNYSSMLRFSEMDFVVAGPGAKSGISKCFANVSRIPPADVIAAVSDTIADEFDRAGLRYPTLWGRKLHLIDLQNLFCEVDKYARVAHPEVNGSGGRVRIKQKLKPSQAPLPQYYPPRWGIKAPKAAARRACKSAASYSSPPLPFPHLPRSPLARPQTP